MERLGTTLHWASTLPDGWRVETRPDVAAWLGWSSNDQLFRGLLHPPGHIADRMRRVVAARDITPREAWPRRTWQPSFRVPVVLCTASSRHEKDWVGWSALRSLLDHAGIDHAAQTNGSIHELEDQLATARAVVAVDSGPMHLAAYTGTPTVGVFVVTDPTVFGPRGARSIALVRPSPAAVFAALILQLGAN